MPRSGMRRSHLIGSICWLGWMFHLCVAVASLAAVVQSCSFEGSARFATLSFPMRLLVRWKSPILIFAAYRDLRGFVKEMLPLMNGTP